MLLSRMSPNMPVQKLIPTSSWCCLLCSMHTKLRKTPMKNNIRVYSNSHCAQYHSNSHSAQSHCFMNTDYQRSQKFWIFVKCEQHSTKINKFNSSSIVITSSAIGSKFPVSAISVTCDSLSFKTGHLISTMKKDIRHDKLQEITFYRISKEITIFDVILTVHRR